MLAATLENLEDLDWSNGYLATPKLDGIRALLINGKLVSRTFKPIRNTHIKTQLEKHLPEGADGEVIISHDNFQETSGGVMREEGTPDFTFYWFDWVKDELGKTYTERMADIEAYSKKHKLPDFIQPLLPTLIESQKDAIKFEDKVLEEGYEGVIFRSQGGPYKCGRSTMREEFLMKFKQFSDGEAVIVGFGEKMHNENEAKKDNFGRTKRSTAQDGLVPAGTLGKFFVKEVKTGVEFEIGSGMNDALRAEVWKHKKDYLGKIVKYRHFEKSGVKDKPRFPTFEGFRDPEDM
jgi:DNA ligase-1